MENISIKLYREICYYIEKTKNVYDSFKEDHNYINSDTNELLDSAYSNLFLLKENINKIIDNN